MKLHLLQTPASLREAFTFFYKIFKLISCVKVCLHLAVGSHGHHSTQTLKLSVTVITLKLNALFRVFFHEQTAFESQKDYSTLDRK